MQDLTACLDTWDHPPGGLTAVEMGALVEQRDEAGGSGACGGPTTLYRLPCTSDAAAEPSYEQASLVAIMRLTDDKLIDVTSRSQTSFASGDSSVATIEGSVFGAVRNRLYPRSTGAVALTAQYAGEPSRSSVVTVADDIDYIADVSITADWCQSGGGGAACASQFCSSTFAGLQGSSRQLSITLTTSSGFLYANVQRYSSVQPGVFPLETLVAFESDSPADISLSSRALATLGGNSACGPAVLSASVRSQCRNPAEPASDVGDTMEVFANLNPTEFDVDLGQAVGPPLHAVSPCQPSVQVNAHSRQHVGTLSVE